ncbi:MAG: MoxR family ATPase [Planctomycetota bacterium]|nr:MoxR family ATPase [Planctomycetota bacterium]
MPIEIEEFKERFDKVLAEVRKAVIGQEAAVEQLLVTLFAEGHVLLSGVPGLGRTLLGKSLARVLGLTESRIQFTPDLLPTDILGVEVLQESPDKRVREFRFFKGPVFANLVLADEINRSPPRTQSALLEVMQERWVTLGGVRHRIPDPFMIVATQNALETEGVYPMPEAQLDRFMMYIELDYPSEAEESAILDATTGLGVPDLKQVLDGPTVLEMQALAKLVPVAPAVKRFAVELVRGSRPGKPDTSGAVGKQLRWGASPRAGQCLLRAAKVLAIVRGRKYATRSDIAELAMPVLRHRLIPDYRAGTAELARVDEIIRRLVEDTARRLSPEEGNRRLRSILRRTRSGG